MPTPEGAGSVSSALGDVDSDEFTAAARAALDWISRYLAGVGSYPVMAKVTPGQVRGSLPARAPTQPEPLADILADFESLIMPGVTHWQHPRFLGYFSAAGSAPGILAELLCAALNVNGMLWRTSPALTELEEVTTAWLRDEMGLPAEMSGVINDTASTGTLCALAAAREQALPDVRRRGMLSQQLRLYMSEEAHSSVEKAALLLGVGQDNVVRVPADAEFRMDAGALNAAVRRDRNAGHVPLAIVATVGTTGVAAVDPVADIAEVCRREAIWLHVDAAYAGAAALLPEMRWILLGCDRADSLVVNPHKWLFAPIDCSVLFCRREDMLRRAFSLVPDYLSSESDVGVRNLMDYGVALGRRFRALKLWYIFRAFGSDGIRQRIAAHIAMARGLAARVEVDPHFELLAPVHFSTVVFRCRPPGLQGAAIDHLNQRIVDAINTSGAAYISHTRVRDVFAIRIAIGNLHTTEDDLRAVWELVQDKAAQLTEVDASAGPV